MQSQGTAKIAQPSYRFWGVITDTETLLRTILEEGLEAVNATRGTISLVDHRTGELVTKFVVGEQVRWGGGRSPLAQYSQNA